MAAVAAHELSSVSGHALLASKALGGAASLSAGDSSFASVLAQLANMAGPQAIPQTTSLPSSLSSFSVNAPQGVNGSTTPTTASNVVSGSGGVAANVSSDVAASSATTLAQSGAPVSGASPLPGGVPSYAQSLFEAALPAGSTQSPSSAQQAAAAWLRQQMAAQAPAMNAAPAGASSSSQNGASSTPVAQQAGAQAAAPPTTQPSPSASGLSAWLQQIQAANAHVSTALAQPGMSPTNSVTSYGPTVAAQNANTSAASNTILAANSTQSVAAMFSVPSFPAAMAFASPSSTKAPAANAATNAAAQANAGEAAAAQNATTAANAVPASQAAELNDAKAAVLAQAEQQSVRTGRAAPVTESQSLPVNFDVSEATASSKAGDAHSSTADDAKSTQTTDDHPAVAEPVQSAATQTQTQALHTAPASQGTPAPQADAANISNGGPAANAQAFAPQTQTNAAQSSAPSTAPAPATPTASIGTPDISALAINIAAKSQEGARQFDIRLDPAELGRVDVRLSVDGMGTAQAHLSAERPETLSLLQNNAPALSRALQESGVNVANNGLQFSLKGQDRQGDAQPRSSSRSRSSAAQSISAAASLSGASASYGLSPSGSGVNILV